MLVCRLRNKHFYSTHLKTRPRGARHFISGRYPDPRRFNPRAHAGRDEQNDRLALARKFQSTRPRGARPIAAKAIGETVVSIHAPTRGATNAIVEYFDMTGFNPRAHAGRDIR